MAKRASGILIRIALKYYITLDIIAIFAILKLQSMNMGCLFIYLDLL